MASAQVADVPISWCLRHKGICLSHLGKYEDSLQLFKEAVKIRYRGPGSKFDVYSAVANTYRKISHLLKSYWLYGYNYYNQYFPGFLAESQLRFKRYEEAIKTSEEVLALLRKVSGTGFEKWLREIVDEIIRKSREGLPVKKSQNL